MSVECSHKEANGVCRILSKWARRKVMCTHEEVEAGIAGKSTYYEKCDTAIELHTGIAPKKTEVNKKLVYEDFMIQPWNESYNYNKH